MTTPNKFPDITTWTPQCRLCKLARDYPGVTRRIHDLAHERSQASADNNVGADALAVEVVGICERHGIKPFDAQNLRRHFTKHVDFSKSALVASSPDVIDDLKARLASVDIDLREADPSVGAHGKADNDYFVMWDLFRRLMRRITALDADPTAFLTLDGRHDMMRLNTWTSMIDKARSALSDLNKMRNSDKLTLSILNQHTVNFSKIVAAGIRDEMRVVLDELRRDGHDLLADRLENIVSERVPLLFATAGQQVLNDLKEKYKLLH